MRWKVVVLLASGLAVGLSAGAGSAWLERGGYDAVVPVGAHRVAEEPGEFRIFWEVWEIVQEGFDGPIPTAREATYGAIRGMLAALDDPNTFFSEPAERELEIGRLEGQFGGIGIEDPSDLDVGSAEPEVRRVRPGSPAARAGLGAGDILVQVDGIPLAHLSPSQVIALLRGPVGSEISVVLRRDGLVRLHLRREAVASPTVVTRTLPGGVGYLSVTFFGDRTIDEVRAGLAGLDGWRGLVLDLRDAPGGVVEAAVDVADLFLANGPILFQRDAGGSDRPLQARAGDPAEAIDLAVLVNGGTASAAEIVAAALQDHGRAVLLGEPTFGKGSVQRIHQLGDGSSLHVTVSVWLTPDRREIEGVGLSPDLIVPSPGDGDREDPVLEAALQRLLGK